jgi:thiamine-monophosphate kinase
MNEIEIVAAIQNVSTRVSKRRASPGLLLGIGDDCAIYRPRANEDLLFTTDQMIEGVHFPTAHKPAVVGERALARSLSDIAATGGTPRFCLVALATPADHERWIKSFYLGLMRLANRTGVALAGGDLACDRKVHCDVMVCGSIKRGKALRRDGARAGDAVYVSGRLGKSWERKIEPRLALGQSLVGRATACIDVSDGLALDLHRLCVASGVGAAIDQVPVARGSVIERALHGGEDYELLFTLPSKAKAPSDTTRIGTIVRAKAGAMTFEGRPLEPRGWDHYA